jgi:hypothetical protein
MAIAGSAAADDTWSLSKLVPFQKSSTPSRARASVSDSGRSSSSWISLPSWGSKSHATPKRHEPSMLDKFTQGTKDTWHKTTDLLTPWDGNSSKKSSAARKSAKKNSWFSSWMPQKKSKPREVQTVKDFLGQPRPEF